LEGEKEDRGGQADVRGRSSREKMKGKRSNLDQEWDNTGQNGKPHIEGVKKKGAGIWERRANSEAGCRRERWVSETRTEG